MTERLFGTDGIRGKANVYPMNVETALQVGRAAGFYFQQDDRPHTILIGKDTRKSGYMLENALTAGLCAMGVNVEVVGPLPTPGVSYIMRSLRADAAIMISASHNPYEDNGIKFFGPDGFKLPDDVEDEIEHLVKSDAIENLRPTGDEIGWVKRIDDAQGRYIEYAKSTFPKGVRLDGLKIVVDSAHGACYKVGPNTIRELGAEVISIGDKPNGTNINEACGSTEPFVMQQHVIGEKADLGIAFDGDGDRVVFSDENGQLIDGNAVIAILATDLLERDLLPTKTIVTTIMANGGLSNALKPLGGKILHTRVGDRYVVEAMREGGMLLGGESSGHVIMLEHNTTGDALITALQMLAVMIRKGQKLSELASIYTAMPEAHASIPLNGAGKPPQEALNAISERTETELNGKGRVVIRPSGTEPIVRIMVQHDSQEEAEKLVQLLSEEVKAL
ncbi:MAG TPA: phosphoglucosamine mutase [Candidatus Hydrogenedentes bacterium]|nr:phosphoglucosamine mutase [Candidatus Hydrogenedentota bacterium]